VHYVDESSFTPSRAQVQAGTPVRFTNYGIATHTLVSSDGGWSPGPIAPGQSATVTIRAAGRHNYATEFPWSRAQLIVR
jgi:plastocyanin